MGVCVGSSGWGVPANLADTVVLGIRLPRLILASMAGAGLAAAGVAFQAILHNPLADPYIVGVSGGAALGGVLAIAVGTHPAFLPICSFGGAALSTLLLFVIAKRQERTDPVTLLLVGVVFNAFAAAVVTFVKAVVTATKAQEILFWLMGTITVQTYGSLILLFVHLLVGSVVLLALSSRLNLLTLGDDDATGLGLNVEHTRLVAFLAAALLVGAVVSVVGMIGFVGLVIPHVMRGLVGCDHRILLPASIVGGAAFLTLADTLARSTFVLFATELPVGVITAFAGGPFFLYILMRR